MGRNNFKYTRLLRAPSNLALNTSRDRAPTISLGNQCPTPLTWKNFFLISSLHFSSFRSSPSQILCQFSSASSALALCLLQPTLRLCSGETRPAHCRSHSLTQVFTSTHSEVSVSKSKAKISTPMFGDGWESLFQHSHQQRQLTACFDMMASQHSTSSSAPTFLGLIFSSQALCDTL